MQGLKSDLSFQSCWTENLEVNFEVALLDCSAIFLHPRNRKWFITMVHPIYKWNIYRT